MNWQGSERRRFPRADFPCKIIVYTPDDHVLLSHTENIGAGGIRVILDEKLKLHTQVGLEIYIRSHPIKCKGRVVWVLERIEPVYKEAIKFDTGIEFLDISNEDREIISVVVEQLIKKNNIENR